MTDAPHIDWSDIDGLDQVVAALGGSEKVRLVGGCVRDRLLGRPVGDIDMATLHPPETTTELLENAGLRAIPTGIDHGTVTALAKGRAFEITTLRRDVETDGRHAVVAYSTDWAEDAARRDFTINALYSEADSGTVHDHVGGLEDLKGPVVRFVGEPKQRIAEDYLRILRYFRFLAHFGSQPADRETLAACEAARNSLMSLSRERISREWLKLLEADDPTAAIAQMDDIALFQTFLPEIVPDPSATIAKLVALEHQVAAPPEHSRRLSALLPPDERLAAPVAARLKFSNKLRDRLRTLAIAHRAWAEQSISAHALAYRHGKAEARDAILIVAALSCDNPADTLSQLDDWEVPVLPIKGGELISRGLPAGPDISKALKAIEQQWIEQNFANGDAFDAIVEQTIANIHGA